MGEGYPFGAGHEEQPAQRIQLPRRSSLQRQPTESVRRVPLIEKHIERLNLTTRTASSSSNVEDTGRRKNLFRVSG